MALHVLMTAYCEEAFLPYALKSCLPHVDTVTIVEGAYKETIALGKPARSDDGTIDILCKFKSESDKIKLLQANEVSDAQQRNVGLQYIKSIAKEGDWMLIIDGDEVYTPESLKMVKALCRKMEVSKAKAAYFKSLTFVNDFQHYCEQEFPRLFKITPDCFFTNDNYVRWGQDASFQEPSVIRAPNISFFHYSFCKGSERFALKKKWWETRFGQFFDYSWCLDKEGKITDANHKIKEFTGKHPAVMRERISNG